MNNRHLMLPFLGSLALFGPASATQAEAGEIRFGYSQVCIQTTQQSHQLSVELATTAEQRARGLMERTSLPSDRGMLFLYPHPQPASHGLWMYQTRIPLDAAFMDVSGKIVSIHSMDPCTSESQWDCPVYEAGAKYLSALEVKQGVLEKLGVQVGDVITEAPAGCPALDGDTAPSAQH